MDLIRSAKGLVPESEFLRMQEYAEYNEHGLAVEHLCDILNEGRIPCPTSILEQIDAVGRAMSMDPAIWSGLRNDNA